MNTTTLAAPHHPRRLHVPGDSLERGASMNALIKVAKTMSSVELVAVINEMREAGKAELRHSDFMVKLEKHPGIDSPKFSGQYKDGTGRNLKCYRLPKRECELMVMSESLAVQAKVYDRMAELETQSPAPAALTMLQVLEIATRAEQARLELVAKVAEQATKVAALDRAQALQRDCKAMELALAELSHRMRICFGEIDASDLDTPLVPQLEQQTVAATPSLPEATRNFLAAKYKLGDKKALARGLGIHESTATIILQRLRGRA